MLLGLFANSLQFLVVSSRSTPPGTTMASTGVEAHQSVKWGTDPIALDPVLEASSSENRCDCLPREILNMINCRQQ